MTCPAAERRRWNAQRGAVGAPVTTAVQQLRCSACLFLCNLRGSWCAHQPLSSSATNFLALSTAPAHPKAARCARQSIKPQQGAAAAAAPLCRCCRRRRCQRRCRRLPRGSRPLGAALLASCFHSNPCRLTFLMAAVTDLIRQLQELLPGWSTPCTELVQSKELLSRSLAFKDAAAAAAADPQGSEAIRRLVGHTSLGGMVASSALQVPFKPHVLPPQVCRRLCLVGKRLAAFAAAVTPASAGEADPPMAVCLQLTAATQLAAGCAALARACQLPPAAALQIGRDVAGMLVTAGSAFLRAPVSGSRLPDSMALSSPRLAARSDFGDTLVYAQVEAMLALLQLCAGSSATAVQQLPAGSLPPGKLLPWLDAVTCALERDQRASRAGEGARAGCMGT